MSEKSTINTTLSIVIHTEEEFEWSGGFNRQNDKVSHGPQLLKLCEQMLGLGYCVTLAMDWAFVSSTQGLEVIEKLRGKYPNHVEFATHLHPWVNPPFDEQAALTEQSPPNIDEILSYPGNLPYELEKAKLEALTDKITSVTNIRPTAYLAGRYGTGQNTYKILTELGYTTDVSISPFANFAHQHGPDFSSFTNQPMTINGISCIPHSSGYISNLPAFSDWLNKDSTHLQKLNNNVMGKVILRLLGVKIVRLSPEGFSAKQMRLLAQSLIRTGVTRLIYSFHSSSSMVGGSPYSHDESSNEAFILQNHLALVALKQLTTPSRLDL